MLDSSPEAGLYAFSKISRIRCCSLGRTATAEGDTAMSWDPSSEYKSVAVATKYDAIRFHSVPGRIFNFWEQRLILKCFSGVARGAHIVDVPCGTGRLADPLLSHGYHVHGIDISRSMLRVAEERLKHYGPWFTQEVLDVMTMDRSNADYDGVLCARVLMHFPIDQQIAFLSRASRLSKKIVVINHGVDTPYQRLRRRIKKWLGMNAVPARFPIKARDIQKLLKESGLIEIKRYRMARVISEAIYIVAHVAER